MNLPSDNRHSLRIRSEFLRLGVFPLYQRHLHPTVYRHLKEYQSWEHTTNQKLGDLQRSRLAKLIRHAAKHVPYYRDEFRSRGLAVERLNLPEDLIRLPILRKETLQTRVRELTDERIPSQRLMKNASGGSTGKPVEFCQDEYYWAYSRAAQWSIEQWWGIRPGDRTASVWGCDRDLPEQSFGERLYGKITQMRVCNAFAMSEAQMDSFAQMMVRWRPPYVVGYASALEVFSNFLVASPKYQIRPIAIKSSAEVLTDAQRKIIGEAFQAPVYNFYGSREINTIAAECPAHKGLHINSLGRCVEIVDDDGRSLPPGVPGRILVTDLTNFTMPFLRYQLEDIGSWAEGVCPCGRVFPRLEKVWGRSSDFIVAPSGTVIHGEYFTHLFYGESQVQTFQLVQDSINDVRLDYVLRPAAADIRTDELKTRIQIALGPTVNIKINRVNEIHRPLSGKHRFAISSVPINWKQNHHSSVKVGSQ